MLFGRRKPGYTTTVDAASDPEQVIPRAAKGRDGREKKPKAEVFDIDAASETARRLKETGSMFDGSAAKLGEDVIAAVQKGDGCSGRKAGRGTARSRRDGCTGRRRKTQLLDFLAAAPEAEGDPTPTSPPSPRRSCPS